MTRISREFTVYVPLAVAWQHLASVEGWPSWAKHIRRAELTPRGQLTSQSSGTFHLGNGVRSTFKMAEYNPHNNWKWVGRFLWLSVSYDHRFQSLAAEQTKLIWTIEVEGVGERSLGRVFVAIYRRNLDKAIPNLIAEMKSLLTFTGRMIMKQVPVRQAVCSRCCQLGVPCT